MPKLATVESHSCILLLAFHSAYYLRNFGGFHAIKATTGRSLGGSIYIYIIQYLACVYVYTHLGPCGFLERLLASANQLQAGAFFSQLMALEDGRRPSVAQGAR